MKNKYFKYILMYGIYGLLFALFSNIAFSADKNTMSKEFCVERKIQLMDYLTGLMSKFGKNEKLNKGYIDETINTLSKYKQNFSPLECGHTVILKEKANGATVDEYGEIYTSLSLFVIILEGMSRSVDDSTYFDLEGRLIFSYRMLLNSIK